jgi:hypothetical protein
MTNTYRAMCAELVDALDNLLALVNSECPSLLDGDRGGSGFLDIEIDDALTTARTLLAQPEPEGLVEIALQMLGTITSMELIIPEITDTIRNALEQGRHPKPQPPANKEPVDHVGWFADETCLENSSGDIAETIFRMANGVTM